MALKFSNAESWRAAVAVERAQITDLSGPHAHVCFKVNATFNITHHFYHDENDENCSL
jgi:hypothetical protein